MEIQCPHCSQPQPTKPTYYFIYFYTDERGKQPYTECAFYKYLESSSYFEPPYKYFSRYFSDKNPTMYSSTALFPSVRQAEQFMNMLTTHKPRDCARIIIELRVWEWTATGYFMSEKDTMTREDAERFWKQIDM